MFRRDPFTGSCPQSLEAGAYQVHQAEVPRKGKLLGTGHFGARFLPFSSVVGNGCFTNLTMAPPLDAADLGQIDSMLQKGFSTQEIVSAVRCSPRTVQRRRHRREHEADMSQRRTRAGRRSRITPEMKKFLCDELVEDPEFAY